MYLREKDGLILAAPQVTARHRRVEGRGHQALQGQENFFKWCREGWATHICVWGDTLFQMGTILKTHHEQENMEAT